MGDKKTFINDLTAGPVARQLLLFALPFMLSNLLQTVYNLVDMAVVGKFVGSAGLSAVSTGGRLVDLLTMMCMGLGTGGQILLSQQVGAGRRDHIRRTIGTFMTSLLLLAVVCGAVSIVFHRPLLRLLNTPEEAFQQAAAYMVICNGGCVFIFGYNAICAILRGLGDSRRPFVFIAIASVINLGLDLLFVGVFRWGAGGAAAATVIAQGVAFLSALVYLYRERVAFDFDFRPKSFRVDRPTLWKLTKLGIPLAFQTAAINISMMFVTSFVNAYGVAASAVFGAGMKLQGIPSIVTHAMSQANASMIGQNMAAGRQDRVVRCVHTALAVNASVFAVFIVLCLLLPVQLFSIFTDDAAVLALAPMYLRYACIGYVASIGNATYNAVINGVGFTALSMAIGLLDGVVARISFSLLFGKTLGMGLEGFFLGNNLAIWVTALLAAAYYYSGRWRTRRLLVEQPA